MITLALSATSATCVAARSAQLAARAAQRSERSRSFSSLSSALRAACASAPRAALRDARSSSTRAEISIGDSARRCCRDGSVGDSGVACRDGGYSGCGDGSVARARHRSPAGRGAPLLVLGVRVVIHGILKRSGWERREVRCNAGGENMLSEARSGRRRNGRKYGAMLAAKISCRVHSGCR